MDARIRSIEHRAMDTIMATTAVQAPVRRTIPMITLEDCIEFCGLTDEEVLAIAEHEHVPIMTATALAQHLLSQQHGSEKVRDMIVDDIRLAQRNGSKEHVLALLHVLRHFLKTHPEAKPFEHPWSNWYGGRKAIHGT
jgi:hypothetical protein